MKSEIPQTELCIVMPAYNEEGCIADVVKSWLALFDAIGLENSKMVVVNDGSKDRTGELLDWVSASEPRLIVRHQENGGHGKALLHAYREGLKTNPQWVFQVDSDDQFLPQDFRLLWEKRSQSNFILGRRAHRQDALHRLIITRIVRFLNLCLFGKYVVDANIPFRLIRGSYLTLLLQQIPQNVFAPNIFLSILAAVDGQNLMSIPVQHRDRRTGKVSIVRLKLLKACWRCVRELYAFRRDLQGTLVELTQKKAELGV